MIKVERKDGLTIKLSRILRKNSNRHHLNLYLFIPAELGLNSTLVPEETFYHNALQVKRTYYSERQHLQAVLDQPARWKQLTAEHYRFSLSLYAYQYVVWLEETSRDILARMPTTDSQQMIQVSDLAIRVLERMRRKRPEEQAQLRYYVNIDNYLSWFTEQRILAWIAHLPRNSAYKEIKQQLLVKCTAEKAHRAFYQYNSERIEGDLTRLSNRMRLLRRLIEYPVTLQETTQELGLGEQKILKALIAAIIMTAMSLAIFEVRETLGGFSLIVILILAVLYAVREIFKDDLRHTLWRWLRKGRPKWCRQYRDVRTGKWVGRQLEWFDYTRPIKLPDHIRQIRRANLMQREEMVLHYGSQSRMLPTRFLEGYEQTRESMQLDLGLLARLMKKETHAVYVLNEGQVSRETVEKRYTLNLVTEVVTEGQEPFIQRWKIVINRSKIIEIEEIKG